MTQPIKDFDPNCPQPKDIFGVSQTQFLQNFSFLYDSFASNHIPLDAVSGAGNHNVIQLSEQNSQFQTNAGEISIYAKDVTQTTDQIFMRYQGNQQEFPFTNFQIYPIENIMSGNTVVQTTFITFLPGNLLIYFGEINSGNAIVLNPAVCRNILGCNFCAKDSFGPVPNVRLQNNSSGIFTKVLKTDGKYFYFILGNI